MADIHNAIMKTKLVFNRKSRPGKQLIDIYVYIGGDKKIYIPSGLRILPENWDKKKGCIKGLDDEEQMNAFLKSFIADIEKYYFDFLIKGETITLDDIKKRFNLNIQRREVNKEDDFLDFAQTILDQDMRIKIQSKRPQQRTIEELKLLFGKITFKDISVEMVLKFDNHLRELLFAQNTVKRFHKDFKKFINAAIAYDKMRYEKNPYLRFKPQAWKPKTEFLQTAEITAIELADLQNVELFELARDMFLFSCYTGLRFSDLNSLNKNNFDERPGGLILNLNTQKTDTQVFLRLGEMFGRKPEIMARKYLAMQSDHKYIWGRSISNQKYNQILKDIQTAAGVKTLLTSHLGRHTFGTHYAKETNGNLLQTMAAMGLKSFNTAKIYINLSHQLD